MRGSVVAELTRMVPIPSTRGFTLIETLVASSILITALAGVAQLFIMSAQWSNQAAVSNAALLAAQGKLEELSGATFLYGAAGEPLTDPALQLSSVESLRDDHPPYVDWLDASGRPVPSAAAALLTRRWRITSAGSGAPELIAIEVCVSHSPATEAAVCLATVRLRQS